MVSDKAAKKLGFDAVSRQLRELLTSSMGLDELNMLRPTTNSDARRISLEFTDELQALLLRGESLPLQDFIDVRQYLEQALPEHSMLSPLSLDEIRKVCQASRRIRIFFSQEDKSPLFTIVRPIVILNELEKEIEHTVDANGKVLESASAELRRIRRKLRQRQEALREKLRALLTQAIHQGYAAEHQLTMRAGRMVIPLRSDAKRKMKGFVHDSSATGQTVYLEPAACLDLGNEVRILEGQEQREIERILRELTTQVRQHINAIETNLAILGKIDLLHAKAQLSVRLGGVVPKLSTKPILDIREGKNSALFLTSRSKTVVPLTISLGNEVRTLVITGPNAGGKTVAMKTCGLMLVMLGCGIPVQAHPESIFGTFSQILAEIGDEQSIEQDLSTFSARVSGLGKMCDVAAQGVLLLVDEIGTGTDPAEGAALAQAVLEHFTTSGALAIVTTHHGTLKAYAHEAKGVMNGSMDFDEETLQPTFFFRQGLPGSSYAFRIASRMKFNPDVLTRARYIIGKPGVTLESLITSYRERISRLESNQNFPESEIRLEDEKESVSPITHSAQRRPGKAPPSLPVKLEIGQQVVIDGGSTPSEIISIEGRNALISAGNMRMKVALKRLAPVQTKKLQSKGMVNLSTPQIRIDVRGLRVREALSEVQKFLDQGTGTNLSTVEIIHGTGTGALRSAIHKYLRDPEVNKVFECFDANPGITIVKI
ncbi:MAG: Smr/MutS family protein [Bacteroidetes bacterium]|nr:Smr/MutS family protein [Bacteroidota bacterium]MCY4204642.1 Smr/MutS family protein [Bacteroidota bacterium]